MQTLLLPKSLGFLIWSVWSQQGRPARLLVLYNKKISLMGEWKLRSPGFEQITNSTVTVHKAQGGCAHPAVEPLVKMKPKRSVSGSDPELSSSLRFFWAGLEEFNILAKEKRMGSSSSMQPMRMCASEMFKISNIQDGKQLNTTLQTSQCTFSPSLSYLTRDLWNLHSPSWEWE